MQNKYPEELYWTILINISDAVFLLDENKQFYFVCPNSHVIFGYNYKEIIKQQNLDFIFGSDLVDYELLKDVKEIKNIKRVIYDKYKVRHILLINIKKVDIGDGKILITCRDITEYSGNYVSSNKNRILNHHISEIDISTLTQSKMYLSELPLTNYHINHFIKKDFKVILFHRRNTQYEPNSNVKEVEYNSINSENFKNELIHKIKSYAIQKNTLLFIDNFSYLYRKLGFESTIKLIYELEDIIQNTSSSILFKVNLNLLDSKEISEMSSYFQFTNINSILNITNTQKYLLEQLAQSSMGLNMNTISKLLNFSRLTTRKYVNELFDKGLVSIDSVDRNKFVKLTEDGFILYNQL